MKEWYTEEISRANPSCIVFLIDQSGSMADQWGNTGKSKAEGVANVINRLIADLIGRCTRGEDPDKPRDYYYIGVIGYGFAENAVGSAFKGPLIGQELVPISELALNPTRIEERTAKEVDAETGRLIEVPSKFAVWFDPVAVDGTPMCQALRKAHSIAENFVKRHPHSFPPIVVNITDGESTDGNPLPHAEALRSVANANGSQVLLFNIHISSIPANPIIFPDREEGLPDEYARLLFYMSSVLPQSMIKLASQEMPARQIGGQARGFAFNVDMKEFIYCLDIGTRVGESQMR